MAPAVARCPWISRRRRRPRRYRRARLGSGRRCSRASPRPSGRPGRPHTAPGSPPEGSRRSPRDRASACPARRDRLHPRRTRPRPRARRRRRRLRAARAPRCDRPGLRSAQAKAHSHLARARSRQKAAAWSANEASAAVASCSGPASAARASCTAASVGVVSPAPPPSSDPQAGNSAIVNTPSVSPHRLQEIGISSPSSSGSRWRGHVPPGTIRRRWTSISTTTLSARTPISRQPAWRWRQRRRDAALAAGPARRPVPPCRGRPEPRCGHGARQGAHLNLADMNRFAALYGVPLEMPAAHPRRSVEAMRLLVAAPEAVRPALTHALYRAYWVEGRDITGIGAGSARSPRRTAWRSRSSTRPPSATPSRRDRRRRPARALRGAGLRCRGPHLLGPGPHAPGRARARGCRRPSMSRRASPRPARGSRSTTTSRAHSPTWRPRRRSASSAPRAPSWSGGRFSSARSSGTSARRTYR